MDNQHHELSAAEKSKAAKKADAPKPAARRAKNAYQKFVASVDAATTQDKPEVDAAVPAADAPLKVGDQVKVTGDMKGENIRAGPRRKLIGSIGTIVEMTTINGRVLVKFGASRQFKSRLMRPVDLTRVDPQA